jgi:hypothetical protein
MSKKGKSPSYVTMIYKGEKHEVPANRKARRIEAKKERLNNKEKKHV